MLNRSSVVRAISVCSVVLAVAGLALMVGTVYANHYLLIGQDPIKNRAGGDNPYNGVSRTLALDGTTIRYYVATSTPNPAEFPSAAYLSDLVNTAATKWNNALPGGPQYRSVTSSSDTDVVVEYMDCDWTPGYFGDRVYHNDSLREATYWDTGTVCVNSNCLKEIVS